AGRGADRGQLPARRGPGRSQPRRRRDGPGPQPTRGTGQAGFSPPPVLGPSLRHADPTTGRITEGGGGRAAGSPPRAAQPGVGPSGGRRGPGAASSAPALRGSARRLAEATESEDRQTGATGQDAARPDRPRLTTGQRAEQPAPRRPGTLAGRP